MKITFLGQSGFALEHEGTTVLIDPWLTGNPKATTTADALAADAILLTHGHLDHYGDVLDIARRTDAAVVALVENAGEIAGQLGDDHDVRGPNLGGTVEFDWGWVRLVPAWHSSTTPHGTVTTPAGLVVQIGGTTIYHLGDTCLFSDLALPGRRTPIDIALVCIGGFYTMDRHDAVEAVKLVGADVVIPCHYDTFPAIETDPQAFKADVEAQTSARVVVLDPGQVHEA